MKQTLTFFTAGLLMLIAFTTKAQDTPDKDDETKTKPSNYISLSMGVSKPFGDFAKIDYYNNKAGFANKGVTYALDGATYLYKNWAVGYTISFQDQSNFSYDDDLILSTGYTADYKAYGSTVDADKRYRSLNILLGPQYTFAVHRFSFDLRASAGVVKSLTTPTLTTTLNGVTNQTASIIQKSSTAIGFAYSGSAAIRFNMGGGVGLILKGNLVNSPGIDITTIGRTTTLGRTVTKQPITEGQILFGLSVNL